MIPVRENSEVVIIYQHLWMFVQWIPVLSYNANPNATMGWTEYLDATTGGSVTPRDWRGVNLHQVAHHWLNFIVVGNDREVILDLEPSNSGFHRFP